MEYLSRTEYEKQIAQTRDARMASWMSASRVFSSLMYLSHANATLASAVSAPISELSIA